MTGRTSSIQSDTPSSDKEVIALLEAESEVYRETVQVALQKLTDIERRLENALKANREYRPVSRGRRNTSSLV